MIAGHLLTITSAAENDFAFSKINAEGWFGASDAGERQRVGLRTGPEAGQYSLPERLWHQSCDIGADPIQPAGGPYYTNWIGGEPKLATMERITPTPDQRQWNDYPNTGSGAVPPNYVLSMAARQMTLSRHQFNRQTLRSTCRASANFTVSRASLRLRYGRLDLDLHDHRHQHHTTTAGTTATSRTPFPTVSI